MEDIANLRWRKSSFSGNGGPDCIEVADHDGRVLVRDTKQHGHGPVLQLECGRVAQLPRRTEGRRLLAPYSLQSGQRWLRWLHRRTPAASALRHFGRNQMGKASRRKQQQRNADHRERTQAAGSIPAPNFEGAAVEATRYALAMVTSVHASPEDLPSLTEDLAANRALQGMVAYSLLLSQLIMESASELADARGTALVDALNFAMEGLTAGEHEDSSAMPQALGTVHAYAEVLNGTRQPETVVAVSMPISEKGKPGSAT